MNKKIVVKIFTIVSTFSLMLSLGSTSLMDSSYSAGTDGTLDTSFVNGIYPGAVQVDDMVVQSDGKLVIVGTFRVYQGQETTYIARINTDGSLDTTFNVSGEHPGNAPEGIILLPSGKFLLYGTFLTYGDRSSCYGLVRLNSDGSLDDTFIPDITSGLVRSVSVQTDGKLVIGGRFTPTGGSQSFLARLNSDGSLDSSFTPGVGSTWVFSTQIQTDGNILAAGSFTSYNGTARKYIARVDTDGVLDTSFDPGVGPNSSAISISGIMGDGRIVVFGQFTTYAGTARKYIARINTNGTLDGTFNPGVGPTGFIKDAYLESDGEVVIGGTFTAYGGASRFQIARINIDGTVGTAFSDVTSMDGYVERIKGLPGGKIIIGGGLRSYNGVVTYGFARLMADDSLDTSFLNDNVTGFDYGVSIIKPLSSGKSLVAGTFKSYNGIPINKIARLNSDGQLDETFDPGIGPDFSLDDMLVQSSGKVIIGNWIENYNGTPVNYIARLDTSGALDSSFIPFFDISTDYVNDMVLQGNDQIIAGGYFEQEGGSVIKYLVRMNSDGSLDGTFNADVIVDYEPDLVEIQPDGKIIAGGYFESFGDYNFHLVRLNTDGSLDSSFSSGTGLDSDVDELVVLSDGTMILGGRFIYYNEVDVMSENGSLIKLNSDGSLDESFVVSDVQFYEDFEVQTDGKIVVGDYRREIWNGLDFKYFGRVYRLNIDGTADTTFFDSECNWSINDLAIQANGGILVAGDFTLYEGTAAAFMTRLNNTLPGGEDIDPPVGSVSINSGEIYTTTTNVTLSIPATNADEMIICNNSSFTACTWESFVSSKAWALDTGDGEKTVYVKLRNSELEESETYTDTIILDTAASTGSVTINQGDASTNNLRLSIVLSAADATSGLYQMIVCESSTFTGCNWEAYSSNKYVVLSDIDEGTKTIYVKYKDNAGLISEIFTDTISLIYEDPIIEDEEEQQPQEQQQEPEEEVVVDDEEENTLPEIDDEEDDSEIPVENSEEKEEVTLKEVLSNISVSLMNTFRKIEDVVATIPVDTSESISATALAVVAVAPAVTIGMGSSFSISSILQFSTFGFAFLGLGKKKRNCGLVYDSVTKEPIKNAIVRIYGPDSNLVATEVTNELGIFESNIETGDYSIVVNVSNYKYPSNIVLGIQDPPYENIYRGGKFHYDSSSTINYSIPVDPLDKNILEDAKVISRNIVIKVFTTIGDMAMIVGLIFTIISYIKNNNTLNLVLLVLYIVIILISMIIRNQGKYRYGRVTDSEGNALGGVELGLMEEEFNTIYAKRVTNEKGRYRFIVPAGRYQLVSLDNRYKMNSVETFEKQQGVFSVNRNIKVD